MPGPLVETAPPVYAPALVAFVGGGGGGPDWGVNLAVGGVAAAGVAWFALGPGEPWHPQWGGWSPHYYDRVNQTVIVNNYRHDVNITNINVHNTYVNYRVPGAVTAVPATAFVHGQPTSRFAQHVDPRQWQNARIQSGTPGIAPVKGSFGPDLRRADYRPPASLNQRQVVATRAPVAPPAFRDNLAQRFAHSGGTVPGAGAPVVRVSAPAHASFSPFSPASHGGWPQQNVRVVPPHSPVIGAAGRPNGAPAQGQARVPGEAPRPGAFAQGGPHGPNETHGVPHPPQFAGRPEGGQPQGAMAGGEPRTPGAAGNVNGHAVAGAAGEAHQPSWMQPHAPMAQRGQPGGATPGQENRQPAFAMQQPHEGAPARAPQPGAAEAPHEPQPHADAHPQAQPRAEAHPQQQPQPREEARPQPQPRAEVHPQPQPREEARPQPQPRAEFHPQPQPQPRAEFHPQPQPQPHAEPHPQPHPQASGGGHDERHRG